MADGHISRSLFEKASQGSQSDSRPVATPASTNAIAIVLSAYFALFVSIWVFKTWHWPMWGDAALIRYVVTAMKHGATPYREIKDINLPGSYLLDWLVSACFGSKLAGIHIYDLALLAVMGLTMMWGAAPGRKAFGLCGACLFALFHARDGFEELGQRDLALAALLLLAIIVVLKAQRTGKQSGLWQFGLIVGFACTVKPLAAIFVIVCVPLLRRSPKRQLPSAIYRIGIGLAFPIFLLAIFLFRIRAWPDFWTTLSTVLPYHTSIATQPLAFLLHRLFTPSLCVLSVCLITLVITTGYKHCHEEVVLLAVGAGFLCYLLQMRGYNYHRYPFAAALILALIIYVPKALELKIGVRALGLVCISYCVVLCPLFLREALSRPRTLPNGLAQMEADLQQHGTQETVQCIDSTVGCLAMLVDLHRTQATGMMYDEFVLHQAMPSRLEQQRDDFLHALEANPPSIIVITAGSFPVTETGYQKLAAFPEFSRFMSDCYTMQADRNFHAQKNFQEVGYRLYERSALPCEEQKTRNSH
jgi:hypothetical protein